MLFITRKSTLISCAYMFFKMKPKYNNIYGDNIGTDVDNSNKIIFFLNYSSFFIYFENLSTTFFIKNINNN